MTTPAAVNQNNLGNKVTSRTISWLDLCTRAWGTEFRAPDHRIYVFSNGAAKDSTDMTTNGFYKR